MQSKGLSRLILVLRLNLWAFLLDGLGVLFLSGAALLWLGGPWWAGLLLALPGLVCGWQGLKLHGTTASKLRLYAALVGRNRHRLRPETFDLYMVAPCGRIMVRSALDELGKPGLFAELAQRVPKGSWPCQVPDRGIEIEYRRGDGNVL